MSVLTRRRRRRRWRRWRRMAACCDLRGDRSTGSGYYYYYSRLAYPPGCRFPLNIVFFFYIDTVFYLNKKFTKNRNEMFFFSFSVHAQSFWFIIILFFRKNKTVLLFFWPPFNPLNFAIFVFYKLKLFVFLFFFSKQFLDNYYYYFLFFWILLGDIVRFARCSHTGSLKRDATLAARRARASSLSRRLNAVYKGRPAHVRYSIILNKNKFSSSSKETHLLLIYIQFFFL